MAYTPATTTSEVPGRLLQMLACPICKNPVSYNEETGRLHCGSCKKSYPVDNGIPVLLIHQALDEK
jgi:hypothetical protein